MMKGKLTIFLLLFWFCSIKSQAQICSEVIGQAEDEYDIGHLYAIPDLLRDCLNRGFTKEEKIRAYRLLTLTYLFIDEPQKADSAYLKLLKLSPEFEPNELTDPIELFYLHDDFITTPYFSLYLLKLGTNRSLPKIIRNFNMDGMGSQVNVFFDDIPAEGNNQQINRDYQHSYNPSWGFNIGSGVEYGFSQKFSIGADLMLTYQQYKSQENSLGGIANQGFSEGQWWIDFPVYFKYNLPNIKYKPYFLSGIQSNLLFNTFSSNMSFIWKQDLDQEEVNNIPQEFVVNFNDQRRNLNFSVLFGAGAKYKVGINYLALEVRYSVGLSNLSVNTQRFADNSSLFDPDDRLMYDALHAGNDFRINNLSFTINYIKPIYKPRKKK